MYTEQKNKKQLKEIIKTIEQLTEKKVLEINCYKEIYDIRDRYVITVLLENKISLAFEALKDKKLLMNEISNICERCKEKYG